MQQQTFLQRAILVPLALIGPLSAGTLDIDTTTSGSWTVNAPSVGIYHSVPLAGYLANSITLFSGGGACTTPGCYDTFDGFWTANFTFTLPADATSVDLSYSDFDVDDRAVLELNGNIIGDLTDSGGGPGNMTFTDGGPNNAYTFGTSTSGNVTSGFNIGGSNTLLLIVNNTQVGGAGPLTGEGFTAVGLLGSITYQETGGSPTAPEPASWLMLAAGLPAIMIAGRRRSRRQ